MTNLYLRFGDIPENETSKIWRGEEEIGEEKGVSVYPAIFCEDGTVAVGLSLPVTRTSLYTFQSLLEYENRPCYLVTGKEIGRGTDNEILLKDVEVVREIKYR